MILLDLYQSEIDDFALSLVEWDRELVEEWVWVLVWEEQKVEEEAQKTEEEAQKVEQDAQEKEGELN